ncbi:MAG: DEAD/DEAH box helicase, partial [Acidimicrobiia bacterium]
MDARDAVAALAADSTAPGRLAHLERLPARTARYGTLSSPLPDRLSERLASSGIDRLWEHQAAAVDHLRAGRHVCLASGTASGKSLCYQLPILEGVLSGGHEVALGLFPTKALAHDQLRSLNSWGVPGLRAVTYDGDTPTAERAWARRHANVVLTNPEMLHVGMLPFHDRWATFFMRLRYVVVDELHVLRGIFGSHAAHLLRRLRRVCARYGSEPVFCFASATIGNPDELASTLCGLPVLAVDDDGSPKGERLVALWDRFAGDDGDEAPSANATTGQLLARFVDAGLRTIAFCPSRRGAELVGRAARRRAPSSSIAVYRGGFLPEERRGLERRLASGELGGVATTNALELGIDISGLDVVVLNGFPGTLASFWQQAGRAGRGRAPSAAILVGGDDLLDRWYLDHPAEVFTRRLEPAVVNPANPFVVGPHVGCAAYEIPLAPDDLLARGEL